MVDRKKVIRGLQQCIKPVLCVGCPYRGKSECGKLLMKNALKLLKMQDYIDNFNDAIKVAQNITEELEEIEI